ncbi:hypothetical protein LCGC14_1142880 [marine sediment metagenome]|uniref:Uncharacterized protein n=1 Tax=marine sediment metagenome TaxID=412755 RepID=A0A0F9Q3G6_9ZZZZ
MSRGNAVKGIFYHVVTKFYHSVMLKILFGEMMINQKRTHASSMLKVGFSGLQGKVVDIIDILRHKVIANKQVIPVGYYSRESREKLRFCPIMGHIRALFPISRSISGNFRLLCPINKRTLMGHLSRHGEVNHGHL